MALCGVYLRSAQTPLLMVGGATYCRPDEVVTKAISRPKAAHEATRSGATLFLTITRSELKLVPGHL